MNTKMKIKTFPSLKIDTFCVKNNNVRENHNFFGKFWTQ